MPQTCTAKFPACVTQYFTLRELTVTSTGLANQPESPIIIANLRELAMNILHPLFEEFGPRLTINSAYRSAAVNRAVGGSDTSQHLTGQAADFEVRGMSNYDLACWVRDNLNHGQLILEHFTPGVHSSGWVHCSFQPVRGQREEKTKFKNSRKLHDGILFTEPANIIRKLS
ncbi:D-Ala-D-Ala carboxypeptidase family metallohydrolase [Limnobacter humi]|uniref:D-Ala-D-Ala carboxypeptidase family metallohydrolase n=1 Tax=Limnobacter humi TaxID=1778671 RepID=A0ABT1WIR0_9BURK|nr:D-Ala-D-Ala carboxypeptidase family metallohydrolase [Limnobacter humi]MCQ8897400.1 D-Ala-D-Ala carboxypeptidase family metallohydrolase [Limnobacter humi]